ncbi:hypothetical protein OBBRIDRAFT_811610 [Obba rivulosa]|uniref:Uncharacterized protein n=1 Tax=Obba rivulosa TaxID=1052685 RepID=A0A8E2AXW8_9APHY|nr:hypothetical protein OBBRIDRAFT_811610 [Obba rivulosa]
MRNDEIKDVPFSGRITSKNDVELFLRRAQAAVLNPPVTSARFLDSSMEELRVQMSSADLVGLELTDLSFIDIPGILQNADPEVVKLVEDLVRSHIKGTCLILVALPMSDDIENQKAAQLAKRKILRGVLTKSDTLAPGSTNLRELWLDVIEGCRHPLTHGYFCTRHPDDEERASGVTASEARATSTEFFSSTPPWSTSMYKERFVTGSLVKSLSKLLTRIIDDV